MSNCLLRALGKKANRHVFAFNLTNKQKRYVLFRFLKKKIQKAISALALALSSKLTFSFSDDKTTSIIFRFLYFPFFCGIINPRISFMSFFVFIVFSQVDHTVFVDVGRTKSMRVMNKVLKIEHRN